MTKKLTRPEFINFWKQYYSDYGKPDSDYYDPYIGKKLTPDGLDKLWQWKMLDNYRFHRGKVEKMCCDIEKLKEFRGRNLNKENFDELMKYSFKIFRSKNVYRMFLFHIIWPDEFAILDQHAIRSFIFFTKGEIVNAPSIDKDIQFQNNCLYNQYNDFVHNLREKYNLSFRDIDKALWTFGKFLKDRFSKNHNN